MLRRTDLATLDIVAPLLVEIDTPAPFRSPELNQRLALLRDAASWAGRLRWMESDDPLPGEPGAASTWTSIGDAAAEVIEAIGARRAA